MRNEATEHRVRVRLKRSLFLPRSMRHHILSMYTSRDARRRSCSSCSHTNGERLAFSWALSALMGTTARWHLRLAKKKERAEPGSKPPQAQSRVGNVQALNQPCQDKVVSLTFPFPVQTFLRTTRKEQQELRCPKKAFHSRRVQPHT